MLDSSDPHVDNDISPIRLAHIPLDALAGPSSYSTAETMTIMSAFRMGQLRLHRTVQRICEINSSVDELA